VLLVSEPRYTVKLSQASNSESFVLLVSEPRYTVKLSQASNSESFVMLVSEPRYTVKLSQASNSESFVNRLNGRIKRTVKISEESDSILFTDF